MPAGFHSPSPDQYYRALDAVAATKAATEAQLYATLTDLTNLELRLVCYDLTSTYFEGSRRTSDRFPSKAFGYPRDRRGDRPQVVVGLLCTGDGIPIAHHVFAGDTGDVTTLPGVLEDLQSRFGVGRICVVADRGLISEDNVEVVAGQGSDHVFATRLHGDKTCGEALARSVQPDATWVPVPAAHSAACVAPRRRQPFTSQPTDRHFPFSAAGYGPHWWSDRTGCWCWPGTSPMSGPPIRPTGCWSCSRSTA